MGDMIQTNQYCSKVHPYIRHLITSLHFLISHDAHSLPYHSDTQHVSTLDGTHAQSGDTALAKACNEGNLEVVNALLSVGSTNINNKNQVGVGIHM